MGVSGLLGLLKPVITPIHIKALGGKRVAIDAYGWLHRGAYTCAMELAEGKDPDGCKDLILVHPEPHLQLLVTPPVLLPRCLQTCTARIPPVDPIPHRLAQSLALPAVALAPSQT